METLDVLLLSGVVAFGIVWAMKVWGRRRASRRLAEQEEQKLAILQKPEPSCGDRYSHYVLTKEWGIPCPACAAKRAREARDREADAFAKKLAAAIADELARREKTEEKSHG